MNLWMISAIIAGLLVISGIAIVMNTQPIQADESSPGSCAYGSADCPYKRTCSAENNCGLSACGTARTGSCGCGN